MTLEQWERNSWLKRHATNRKEIANLFSVIDRDLKDAGEGDISADWKFGIAYNAVLTLCSVLLYSEGYRPGKGNLGHYYALASLAEIIDGRKGDIEYLQACRAKRNTVEYDYAGGTTDSEARELLEFAQGLRADIIEWLRVKHPELLPGKAGER